MEPNAPQGLRPNPSMDSKPYWDGLLEGRLLFQQCADCGAVRHYPRPVCPACHSFSVRWVEAAGHGKVHSWSTTYHPFHPAYKKDLPLTYVTVDMPEGVRVLAPLRGGGAEKLKLGLAVRIGIERVDDTLALPIARIDDTED